MLIIETSHCVTSCLSVILILLKFYSFILLATDLTTEPDFGRSFGWVKHLTGPMLPNAHSRNPAWHHVKVYFLYTYCCIINIAHQYNHKLKSHNHFPLWRLLYKQEMPDVSESQVTVCLFVFVHLAPSHSLKYFSHKVRKKLSELLCLYLAVA